MNQKQFERMNQLTREANVLANTLIRQQRAVGHADKPRWERLCRLAYLAQQRADRRGLKRQVIVRANRKRKEHMPPDPLIPTTREACPRCGELAPVHPLPDNPLVLNYTCPNCGFHDRWLTPTPAGIPTPTLLTYLHDVNSNAALCRLVMSDGSNLYSPYQVIANRLRWLQRLSADIRAELNHRSRENGLGTSDMPASPQVNRAVDIDAEFPFALPASSGTYQTGRKR